MTLYLTNKRRAMKTYLAVNYGPRHKDVLGVEV